MAHRVNVSSLQMDNSPNKSTKKSSWSYEVCRPVILVGKLLGIISWNIDLNTSGETQTAFWKGAVYVWYQLLLNAFIICNENPGDDFNSFLIRNRQNTNGIRNVSHSDEFYYHRTTFRSFSNETI